MNGYVLHSSAVVLVVDETERVSGARQPVGYVECDEALFLRIVLITIIIIIVVILVSLAHLGPLTTTCYIKGGENDGFRNLTKLSFKNVFVLHFFFLSHLIPQLYALSDICFRRAPARHL